MKSSDMSRRAFLRASMLAVAGSAVGLAGCATGRSNASSSSAASSSASSTSESGADQSSRQVEAAGGSAKTLVVYFSYTGNVDTMAHWIASETNGDLVRVTARDAYPDDYDATVDRAKEELDKGMHPEIDVDLSQDQLADYDTVFFGFPFGCTTCPCPCVPFWKATACRARRSSPFSRMAAAQAVPTA